jgi:hypothetical protein
MRAAQAMAEFGEPSPLGVIETQAPPFQPRFQYSVLFPEKRDRVLLLAQQPAAQYCHYEVKRRHR